MKGRPNLYNPQVGDIWWFCATKKHYLFLTREKPTGNYSIYKWQYLALCLEDGTLDTEFYGVINAYGPGWWKKVA